jgi:hypothetical protein
MSITGFIPGPFIFDRRQKRIYNRLNDLLGPGPAFFYRDACILMASELPISSTSHLVAHLLRDVESALRDILETFVDEAELKRVRNKTGEVSHRDEVLVILTALDFSEDDPIIGMWLGLTGKNNVRALHSRAHRNNLAPPRPLNKDFRDFWFDMEKILDEVLDIFESKYLTIHKVLDDLKRIKNPSKKDAEYLKVHIPNNYAAFSYFFQDLDNPAWLNPLSKNGIFLNPPPPIINVEEGSSSHPLWPNSRYLIKMAAVSPNIVLKIALEIETENTNVQSDLVDVACALPAAMAVKFVPKFSGWLKKPFFFLAHKISPLVKNLASNGEIVGALSLSKEMLSFELPGDATTTKEKKYLNNPRPRIDPYEFEVFINETLPVVAENDPYNTFIMLLELLDEALELGNQNKDSTFRDYSEIWRPAIEPHPQNSEHMEPRSLLISAVRDITVFLIDKNPELLEKVIHELDKYNWTTFKRLTLHILRTFGDKHIDLVSKKLLDKELFDSISCYHEYIVLAGTYFSRLKSKEKNTILNWIDKGPKDKKYQEYWQLRRLTILQNSLFGRWKDRFNSLTAKFGQIEYPDLLSWSSDIKTGPTSPLSQEHIENMILEELIIFLQIWQQPKGFTMDSPGGISRALTATVANNPERYAISSLLFTQVDPTYVRGLMSGFREALKANKPFEWEPILKLMEWVVNQERKIPGREKTDDWEDVDPDWGWTRMDIGRLLEDGLNDDKKNPIEYKHKTLVWKIISIITDDPDPSSNDESASSMDPATNSLNTTRGVAFHALIAYALWLKRRLISKEENRIISFNEMPEVRTVLDEHLDMNKDPSLTIRSVYGWLFPNLLYLDRDWVLSNKDRIFPRSELGQQQWNAAWDAFITFSRPTLDLLKILESEYQIAINKLDETISEVAWRVNPGKRLVEHLMIYYGLGVLDQTSSLMKGFWSIAPVSFRSYAFEFVGRVSKDAPPEFIRRYQQLWETRFAIIKINKDDQSVLEESKQFGWLFGFGTFPEEWSLEQLDQVLDITSEIDNDHFVIERLSMLSDMYHLVTVSILGKLLEDPLTWKIIGARKEVEKILTNAIQSDDKKASKIAGDVVNRLAAKGYTDFAQLIL